MDESPTEISQVDGEASGAIVNKWTEAPALQEVESQSQQKGILKEPKTYEDAIPHSVEPQELEKEGSKR